MEKITTGGNKQAQKKCCRVSMSPGISPARQPDSPYAYLVCFCGVVCNLIMFGCSYSYGLLFPLLLDEFNEGKAKTGNSDSLTTRTFIYLCHLVYIFSFPNFSKILRREKTIQFAARELFVPCLFMMQSVLSAFVLKANLECSYVTKLRFGKPRLAHTYLFFPDKPCSRFWSTNFLTCHMLLILLQPTQLPPLKPS